MSRIDYYQLAPEGVSKLAAVTQYLESSSLEPLLRALVEIRVSKINGGVYCVDLHTQLARRLGETQQRLDMLPVWHEAPYFDERERAALTWARHSPTSPRRTLSMPTMSVSASTFPKRRSWI